MITLVWLDLETTGLDPQNNSILEISVALSKLDDPFKVRHAYHAVFGLPPQVKFQPGALALHEKSGLLAECQRSTTTLRHAWAVLDKLIVQQDRSNMPTLAGASVHFDHEFLKMADGWFPSELQLTRRLSHRHYDVSAVKLFCRSLGMPVIPKGEAHRAVADVDEAVKHAKLCAEWLQQWGSEMNAVPGVG